MNISEYLKSCRLAKSITTTQVAQLLNIRTAEYEEMENNPEKLSMATFLQVAAFLSIQFHQLTNEAAKSDMQILFPKANGNKTITYRLIPDELNSEDTDDLPKGYFYLPQDVEPIEVFTDFFDDYKLSSIRCKNWNLVHTALTTENDAFDAPVERGNLLYYASRLEMVIEAAHKLISDTKSKIED